MNTSPTVGRYLVALVLIGFLFSGNSEAATTEQTANDPVPCDYRPFKVCSA